MEQAARLLADITWGDDPYSVMEGASALLIFTEWNAFRLLDMQRVKSLLTRPLIVDLRNIYTLPEMVEAGMVYYSVGRPAVAFILRQYINRFVERGLPVYVIERGRCHIRLPQKRVFSLR